eukprot:403339762
MGAIGFNPGLFIQNGKQQRKNQSNKSNQQHKPPKYQDEYDQEDEEDSEDEEMSEEDVNLKITKLVEAINADPYDFQNYIHLIELYRQNGMLEEDESPQIILDLCQTALKDYKYYKISKIYCKLLIQLYDLQQGDVDAQQVRDGFEKVLQIYGLDVNRSVKFWEPYLNFEKEQMEILQKKYEQSTQAKDTDLKQLEEEISKQNSRIRSIYRRRVIFPTSDMFDAWSEYEQWETDQDELLRNKERYLQANEKINAITNFEENFQIAYQELENNMDIEQMTNLLKKDLDHLAQDNFNYIMLYFERILSEYTLNLDLWKIYIDYTDEKCKKKELKQEIYSKAVKNCPQEFEFWLGYLRELEKNEVSSEFIVETANQALSNGTFEISIQFQYEVLKFLCEYHVRQIITIPGVKPNLENEATLQKVKQIRAMYMDSIDNLKEQNEGDQFLQFFTEKLQLSWAEVEAYKISDKKQVQEIMEQFVTQNGLQMISWANYIKLMRVFPDHEKTLRGLFKRGLQFVKDNKAQLGELWLEWEKKFTTIQNVDQCIKHLKKLNLYSQIGKPQRPQTLQQPIQQEQEQPQRPQKSNKDQERQDKKRKQPETNTFPNDQETNQKRPKREFQESKERPNKQQEKEKDQADLEEHKQKVRSQKKTLYLEQLNEETEEEDITALFIRVVADVKILDIRLIRDEQGKKRGFAFVDVESQEMAEKSLLLNNYNLKGSMLKIHIYKPPNESEKSDFTVYVHGLPQTCNEQKLREHFKEIGDIEQVRLIRNPNGTLKGFGYIQFLSKKSVQVAIESLNKSKIDNRTISVERNKSKKEAREDIGFTVFVKNLDYHTSEDELKSYSEDNFGEVKRVTLSKDEKGHSKGHGFIEFLDEASMNKAIEKKEITDLGRRIGIIMKSLRQVTQPKTSFSDRGGDQSNFKQKRRDAKLERKTLIADILQEVKNEQQVSSTIDQSQNPDNTSNNISEEKQQNVEVVEEIKVDSQIQVQQQAVPVVVQEPQQQMSNQDFKKFLLSKKR